MIDQDIKSEIESMDYLQMLHINRFAPPGHPYLQGEVGGFFVSNMHEKGKLIGSSGRVAASKLIGWDPPVPFS